MSNDHYSQNQQPRQTPPKHAQGYQQAYQTPAQSYQQPYQQQAYPPQQNQQYQRAPQQMRIPADAITGTGEWMLTLLIASIPLVGFIMLLVWSFGSGTAPSKKNWARAILVWMLIGIIVSVALYFICAALGIDVTQYVTQRR